VNKKAKGNVLSCQLLAPDDEKANPSVCAGGRGVDRNPRAANPVAPFGSLQVLGGLGFVGLPCSAGISSAPTPIEMQLHSRNEARKDTREVETGTAAGEMGKR
jgi:hypothetical protein